MSNIIPLKASIDLAKSIISLCLKQIRKMNQPEQFESEVNLLKTDLRVRKTLIPVMPRIIKVIINSLKVTIPLKIIESEETSLYGDEILFGNLNNFVVTTQLSKQDDIVYSSKCTIGCTIAADSIAIRLNSKNSDLVSVAKFEYGVEIDINKVKNEALHHKFFKQKLIVFERFSIILMLILDWGHKF